MATTTTCNQSPSSWDVFLSFYGKDTRRNFISNLYFNLDQAGISTFRDDPALEKGQEISSGLRNAIIDSNIFVVVLSKNYACSPWCLNELVEILGCKKKRKQVIPVFYYVDPSDLRHHTGSFGDAFDHHGNRYSVDLIEKWESALAEIAELSGYHLKEDADENESDIVQEIVHNVAQQASKQVLHLDEYLFGIDSAVEDIYKKLNMGSNDVCAIGICGMGGIGKTTIAKAFYNKYSNIFDISCFIENVKQYSQEFSPLLPLLKILLTELLKKKDCRIPDVASGIRQLKQILHSKKALIVLDDLDHSSFSEFLARFCNLFSAGSRIMITTRDSNLLNQLKVNISEVDIYMVKELGKSDSLKLFGYYAFQKPTPPEGFNELSESFVTYAGGLPLALKVLGSSLRGRTEVSFWKAKLKKVGKFSENKIQKILQLSYDELGDETEKSIFLDIAFFFVGKNKNDAYEIFQSCGFFPEVGIPILVEKCLLTIDKNNIFQMHNLIQDMGRDLGKSRHLFWQGNAWNDLQNQEGTNKIEGLILDLTQSTKKQISSQIFERLPKLRLLEIFDVHSIKGHFRNSLHELRCIYWSYCTWTQLPSSFRPSKLVSLQMPFSSFNILWNDAMPFMSLKTIDVSYSGNLKTTPDFRSSKLVEHLSFHGCESLLKIHPSIRHLTHLSFLNLRECTHLNELAEPIGQLTIWGHLYRYRSVKRLPEPMTQWANMKYLCLGHCSNLSRLPEQLGDMKGLKLLDASHTTIEELPDSITQLKELVKLDLFNCKKLKKLPVQIGNMEGLRTFGACHTAIEQLPDSFVCLVNLERLYLRFCKNIQNLPNDIWKLKLLEVLNMRWCSKLDRLPKELGKMECLEYLNASHTAIKEVPDSIELLSRLRVLNMSNCMKLKHVPNSIWNLTSNRTSQLYLCDEGGSSTSTKPFSLSKLYNLQFLELYDCTSFGSLFPELPPNITHLSLCNHTTLVHLPDLSSLKQLKKLEILCYPSLKSLPPLPPHLQSLMVYDCRSLQVQSDMSTLKELVSLSFGRWSNLKSVGSFKVRRPLFKADVPKIAEWFSYKSSRRTLSFDIPPLLGDDFLGLALWVLFTSKNNNHFNIRAVVTNKTKGITKYCGIPVYYIRGAEVYSLVKCFGGNQISIRSGDSIEISFKRQLYSFNGQVEVDYYEEVKVKMCAAHVIQKSPITPHFSSVLNNLINGA